MTNDEDHSELVEDATGWEFQKVMSVMERYVLPNPVVFLDLEV